MMQLMVLIAGIAILGILAILCRMWLASGEKIERYTGALAALTGMLAIISIVQLCFVFRADDTARTAANAAEQATRSLVLERRPWIGTPDITIGRSDASTVIFTLVFKNVGRTPTKGLFIDANIVPGKTAGDDYNWRTVSTRICAAGKKRPASDSMNFSTFSSVPGGAWPVRIAELPSMSPKAVSLAYLKAMEYPHIAGCVLYGSRLDDSIHQTGFVARIDVDGENPDIAFTYAVEPD